MLEIQALMRSGMRYEQLHALHGVVAKPYNGKVSFAYDMIMAKDDDSIAKQCRGLILEGGTWKLLAYPFDRFFNHGQGAAATIDMASAHFEEKLDGTLIIAYYHKDKWHCATRQMCEAHGDINGVGTFAHLVDKAARELESSDFHALMCAKNADISCTYMFELTSPFNKIVCDYEHIGLTILGMRDLQTLQEHEPPDCFPRPQKWHLSSIDDMLEVASKWSPLKYEGVILKDKHFNRVKIKTPQYLAMHGLSSSLGASWRAIATCILTGAADDIKPQVVPAIASRLSSLQDGIANLIFQLDEAYAKIAHIDDMKAFAAEATQTPWSAPLFRLKRGQVASIVDYIKNANPDTVIEYARLAGWKEPSA